MSVAIVSVDFLGFSANPTVSVVRRSSRRKITPGKYADFDVSVTQKIHKQKLHVRGDSDVCESTLEVDGVGGIAAVEGSAAPVNTSLSMDDVAVTAEYTTASAEVSSDVTASVPDSTDNIPAEDLPDFLTEESQWIEQGPEVNSVGEIAAVEGLAAPVNTSLSMDDVAVTAEYTTASAEVSSDVIPDSTDNIPADDLPDFLTEESQWIEQGPDGSIYISSEFLASLERGVPIDLAVPVNLKVDTCDIGDHASAYVSQHSISFSESQSSGVRAVYTHIIQAEYLPDFLPVKSQWIEQGHDGSVYISNEFLASLEPAVPIAVPVNLEDGNNNDQYSDDTDDSRGGTDSDDDLYVPAESSEEPEETDDEQSEHNSEDEHADNIKQRGSRWKRAHPGSWKKNIVKKMKIDSKKPKAKTCKNCRWKCCEKFTDEDINNLCKVYNMLESYNRKKDFLPW